MKYQINIYSRLRFSELMIRDNEVFWRNIQYIDIPNMDEDIYYTITAGDRPDTLSYKFYKTTQLGWYILLVNGIKYWGDVKVGNEIRIPPMSYLVNLMSNFRYKGK